VHSILALQTRAAGEMPAKRSAKDVGIPLAIMTSDDTHAATLELLERHDYFGAKRSQVTLIKQEKVPHPADNPNCPKHPKTLNTQTPRPQQTPNLPKPRTLEPPNPQSNNPNQSLSTSKPPNLKSRTSSAKP